MAQIEQSDGGKKKKGAQKKMHIHVDFTPMVDMNMLLITFFMLCTTMIKSQTLQIALPAPVDPNAPKEQAETVGESRALTLIVDTQRDADGNVMKDADGNPLNIVYYYEGFEPVIDENGNVEDKLKAEEFIPNDKEGMTRGIRNILYMKNKAIVDELRTHKKDYAEERITKEQYDEIAREIRSREDLKDKSPQVSIKATDDASWQSVIAALDEMQINQISQYRIGTMTHNDTIIINDFNKRNPR